MIALFEEKFLASDFAKNNDFSIKEVSTNVNKRFEDFEEEKSLLKKGRIISGNSLLSDFILVSFRLNYDHLFNLNCSILLYDIRGREIGEVEYQISENTDPEITASYIASDIRQLSISID